MPNNEPAGIYPTIIDRIRRIEHKLALATLYLGLKKMIVYAGTLAGTSMQCFYEATRRWLKKKTSFEFPDIIKMHFTRQLTIVANHTRCKDKI